MLGVSTAVVLEGMDEHSSQPRLSHACGLRQSCVLKGTARAAAVRSERAHTNRAGLKRMYITCASAYACFVRVLFARDFVFAWTDMRTLVAYEVPVLRIGMVARPREVRRLISLRGCAYLRS